MITLQRPDPKVSALLGVKKGISNGDAIRPSQFIIALHIGKRCVVFNTLTKQCVESKYFDWFEHPEERLFDEKDVEMSALVKRDFLVRTDLNETKRYMQLIKVIRKMEKKKAGYTGYTILPTTACNARCVYCYEEGIPYETMTDETVEQTIRYILATKREGSPVTLHWFGGEPLMGEKAIDRISQALRDADIKYKSTMVSNGSLMTREMAKKAKEDWQLKNTQITLDGREEMYCERKRYKAFKGSPYRAVLEGIHAMLDQGIRVSIRMNVDEGNVDELMALTDDLEEEFRNESQVSIYCHGIFREEGDEERDDGAFYDQMEILNDRLSEFNANRRKKLKEGEESSQVPIEDSNIQWESDEENCPEKSDETDHYDRQGFIRRYFCMVDNPNTGGVILPNGDICLCEHIGGIPVVGSIFGKKQFERETFIERNRVENEKCAACALLPVCTDFTSCPACDRDCVRERTGTQLTLLRNLESEDRLPPVSIMYEGKVIRVIEPTAEFAEKCTAILADDYLKVDEYMKMEEAEKLFR